MRKISSCHWYYYYLEKTRAITIFQHLIYFMYSLYTILYISTFFIINRYVDIELYFCKYIWKYIFFKEIICSVIETNLHLRKCFVLFKWWNKYGKPYINRCMFPMEISENGRKWYPFFIVALHIAREWSLTVLHSINLYNVENYTVHYL